MPQFHRNITLITDAKLVEQIKQQARKINRSDGISHTEALETAIKELGYLH